MLHRSSLLLLLLSFGSHYLLPNKKSNLVPWRCRISSWLPVKTRSKHEPQCCGDAFCAGISPLVRSSHVESAPYWLHVSVAVIMLFLSPLGSKGNMLSTPSPLSFFLSLRCLLLPYCPVAWGNSWLSESSSPTPTPTPTPTARPPSPPTPALWAHIDWLSASPPKSRAAWGAGCSFLSVLLKKSLKERGKEGEKNGTGGWQIISGLRHNLSRYVCLFRCNENQLGFSQFLLFLSIVLPRCLQGHVLLLPPIAPLLLAEPLQSYFSATPPSLAAATRSNTSHTITQHTNNPVVCERTRVSLRGFGIKLKAHAHAHTKNLSSRAII